MYTASRPTGTRCVVLGLAALSLALLASLLPGQPASEGKKYALLVGVNEYQHAKLKPLKFAVNDVREMARFLKDADYEVILLNDETGKGDATLQPSKENILKKLGDLLKGCKKGDTFVAGFAGHGLQFEGDKDSYFCPADAKPFKDEAKSLVSLGEVYKEMDKCFAGVKVLLVDACRDDPETTRGIDPDAAPRPPRGVAALFSCSKGERAYEDKKYQHGVFFHYVLEGLRGKAVNFRKEITITSLADYVATEVAREVPLLVGEGAKQSPNLKADLEGYSPVLVRNVSNAARGERHALLIGVEKYDPAELRDVPRAEADVTELAKQLESSGYKKENIILLVSSSKEAASQPSGDNVRKAMQKLAKDRKRDDLLLVAFSGHGVQFKEDEEHYLCPADAKLHDKNTLVALGDVFKELETCAAGRKVLLADAWRDSPQTEASKKREAIQLLSEAQAYSKTPPRDTALLLSWSVGGKAYEDKDLPHGVFFHYVIEGLKGAAVKEGGKELDLNELAFYVLRTVEAHVRSKGGASNAPVFISESKGLAPTITWTSSGGIIGDAPGGFNPVARVDLPGFASKNHKIQRVTTARIVTSNTMEEKGQYEPLAVAMSASGNKIAFFAKSGLYTIDPDGSNRKLVWEMKPGRAHIEESKLLVSHDGRYVFWQSGPEIYRANHDGSDFRTLCKIGSEYTPLLLRQWGRRIFYGSRAGLYSVDTEGIGDIREILTAKRLKELFELDILLNEFDADELGRRVVCRVFIPKEKKHQLCAINADGTEFRVLTRTDFEPAKLTISPDGQHVFYGKTDYSHQEYRVSWDGSEQQEIIMPQFNPGRTFARQFSPDGQWLYYVGGDNGLQLLTLEGKGRFEPFPRSNWFNLELSPFEMDGLARVSADLRRYCFIWMGFARPRQIVVCDINPTKTEGFPSVSDIEFSRVLSNNPAAPNYAGTMKLRLTKGTDEITGVHFMLNPQTQLRKDLPKLWAADQGVRALRGDRRLVDDETRGDDKTGDGVWTTNEFGPDPNFARPGRYTMRIVVHDKAGRAVFVDLDGVEIK